MKKYLPKKIGLLFIQLVILGFLIRFQGINSFTNVWFVNLFYVIVFADYIYLLTFSVKGFFRTEIWKEIKWFAVAVAAIGGMCIAFILGLEDTIKQYDATVYWMKAMDMNTGMYSNMWNTLMQIKETLSADYGNLPVVLFAPFFRYFGKSYLTFCCTTYLVYGIPGCFLLAVYSIRLLDKLESFELYKIYGYIAIAVSFFSPAMLYPILTGYVDMVGVVWIGVLLNLSLEWQWDKILVKRSMLFAGVSLLLLFSRRWYAFWIVGFYLSIGICAIVKVICEKRRDYRKIGIVLINLAIIAGVSCMLIFALNKDVFGVFLGNKLSNAYAAYKTRTVIMDFAEILYNIGGIFCLCLIVGFGFLLVKRKYVITILTVLPAVFAGILFGRIQSMGWHHMYLAIPHFLVLVEIGICSILYKAKDKWKKSVSVLIAILLVMNMGNSFLPSMGKINVGFFSHVKRYPEVMASKGVIKEATQYLRECEGAVYICGEGYDFSCELFNRSLLPNEKEALPNMLGNSIVDARDGFPSQAFLADYIVIRDPYTTGFEDIQQVTYQIYDMLKNSDLGKKYYKVDKVFNLADEAGDIIVYKKIMPLHAEIVRYISDNIFEHYGNTDHFVYEPNYFVALANISSADNLIYNKYDGSFDLYANESAELMYMVCNQFSTIGFEMSGLGNNDKVVIRGDGTVIKELYSEDNMVICNEDVSNYDMIRIIIDKEDHEGRIYHFKNHILE